MATTLGMTSATPHRRRQRAAADTAVATVAAAAMVAAEMEAAKAAAKVANLVTPTASDAYEALRPGDKAEAKDNNGERRQMKQTRQIGKSMSRCATPFGVGRRLRLPKHAG